MPSLNVTVRRYTNSTFLGLLAIAGGSNVSGVVTTSFSRTQLMCTGCCLYMKRVLFKTRRVETEIVHAKAYTKFQKRGERPYYA